MNQEYRQLNTTPHEEQCFAKDGEVPSARRDPAQRQVYRCANCDIEFFWPPTIVKTNVYCCTGCAAGGPCNCDYSLYRSVIILGVVHYEQ